MSQNGSDRLHEYAVITKIQRFSVHDGPGIRTIVFFKGCPLRCKWCQNPETQSARPRVMLAKDLCIGCGMCRDACPQKIAGPLLSAEGIDRSLCTGCASCQEVCFSGAREINGRTVHIQDVLEEVLRDEIFYKNSNGGITVSGGEPLLYSGFVQRLFSACKDRGIHTAVETCGCVPWSALEAVAPVTDLFLYDIKHVDGAVHEEYTGKDNKMILENLERLVGKGKEVIFRIPLIPGVNDNEEMYGGVARLALRLNVAMVHIMPFHQMGSSKWEAAGMPYAFKDVPPLSMERAESAKERLSGYGLDVHIFGY